MSNEDGSTSGWAISGDQVVLAVSAFQYPETFKLCFDGSPNVGSQAKPGLLAIRVSLKKIK